MEVNPVTLAGAVIRLEPLRLDHAADLYRFCTPEILLYHPTKPPAWTEQGFVAYVQRYIAAPDYRPFAQVLQESGVAVGMTCYMDIRPPNRGLEIGATWIAKEYQGTKVNPEAKYLLMRHAFEQLGAVRVQLKTDGRNKQSQAAIAKLGAQYEGTLRKHVIMPDGFIRDTVMFSVIAEEWPNVKAGLEQRLGYVPGAGSAA